mgnify:CR=1 FL=1
MQRSAHELCHLVTDESITRGLGDVEARMLVEWLSDWSELLWQADLHEDGGWRNVQKLCRRARAIGRFVQLWSQPRSQSAALQLVASERFEWPLPRGVVDPGDLMQSILEWENRHPVG